MRREDTPSRDPMKRAVEDLSKGKNTLHVPSSEQVPSFLGRLGALERIEVANKPDPEEVKRYNETDWPGPESFHPPHLRGLANRSREAHQAKQIAEQYSEIPDNIVLGEN